MGEICWNGSLAENSGSSLIRFTHRTLEKYILDEVSRPELHCSEGVLTVNSARLEHERTAGQKESKIEHTRLYRAVSGVEVSDALDAVNHDNMVR